MGEMKNTGHAKQYFIIFHFSLFYFHLQSYCILVRIPKNNDKFFLPKKENTY